MSKYAILLLTEPGSHEAMARAYHALSYAADLQQNGFQTQIIFDGAGTVWLQEFVKADHPLRKLFESTKQKGLIGGYCPMCADSFKVDKKFAAELEIKELDEYNRNPSVGKLARDGFHLITI